MIAMPTRNGNAMFPVKAIAIIAFALWQSAAFGQMNHQHASEAACDETLLRCASKVTPAFGPDGTLWLAWMAGGQISVASSKDAGRSFSPPVQVTKEHLNLDWGPDARPKIVVDRNGSIALAFSVFRDKAFNGQVLTTRSTDGEQALPRYGRSPPATKASASRRWPLMPMGRCLRHGSTSVTGFRHWSAVRNTTAPACFSRRRPTAARPIPNPDWRRTTPANAAAWGWRSQGPAARSLSSETFLKAAFGITPS